MTHPSLANVCPAASIVARVDQPGTGKTPFTARQRHRTRSPVCRRLPVSHGLPQQQPARISYPQLYVVATRPRTDAAPPDDALRALHRTIKKVGEDIDGMRFNTAISALMVLVNEFGALNPIPTALLGPLVQIVAPFAPHLGEELWEMLGNQGSVSHAEWPKFDPALCELSELTIPVQVNGKKRGELKVAKGATETQILELAMADVNVTKHLEGKAPSRVIWVQDRILTLVVK